MNRECFRGDEVRILVGESTVVGISSSSLVRSSFLGTKADLKNERMVTEEEGRKRAGGMLFL